VETMEIETGQIPEAYVLVDAVDASPLLGNDGRVRLDPNMFPQDVSYALLSEVST